MVSAETYQTVFQSPVPLRRMLRRQIEGNEYIALTRLELKALTSFSNLHPEKKPLRSLYFIVPVIKENRGYYETHMQKVEMGTVVDVSSVPSDTVQREVTRIRFENKGEQSVDATSQFIRWLGL